MSQETIVKCDECREIILRDVLTLKTLSFDSTVIIVNDQEAKEFCGRGCAVKWISAQMYKMSTRD